MIKQWMIAGLMGATMAGAVSQVYAAEPDRERDSRHPRSSAAQEDVASPARRQQNTAQQNAPVRPNIPPMELSASPRENAQPAPNWNGARSDVRVSGRADTSPAARSEVSRDRRVKQRDERIDNNDGRRNWRQYRRDDRQDDRATRSVAVIGARQDRRDDQEDAREKRRDDRRGWSKHDDDDRYEHKKWSRPDYYRAWPRYWSDNRYRWDRDWRTDQRYDWRRYRDRYRDRYRYHYHAPRGWSYGYTRFSIGITLWSGLYSNSYWIDDPYYYRLPAVYGPLRWVRYYDDALLVDIRTGYVVDVIYDFFW